MSRLLVAQRALTVPGWAKDDLSRKARDVPSLDLRFAENKSLVDAVTGASLVTFTRASTGTFVGSDGLIKSATTDEARFDHNPTTGESLGLLVEEQRTNLVLRSEELDNAGWTKQSSVSVSANTTISPDGNLTADTITANQSLGIFQNVAATVSTTYTNSVYIKAGTATAIMLRDDTGAGRHIVFDPSTGIITATSGTLVLSGSQALNNGWYRYFMTYVADATTVRGIIRPNSAGSAQTFITWGAQLEAGAFPTSYIATTTATVTRAADVASITGSAFSSWYNQTEGTVFASALVPTVAPSTALQTIYAISDGSTDNRISAYKRANADTSARLDVTAATVGSAFINAGTFGLSNVIVSAVRVNDFAVSLNGLAPVADTSGNVPSVNQINLGTYIGATSSLNGTIRRLTYWPVRLGNNVLQQITQ